MSKPGIVSPLRYLKNAIDTQIYVKLKDGSEYVGTLKVTDGTMNLILEDAVELRNDAKDIVAKVGRVLIRGSMIQYISFNPDMVLEETQQK
jgi:small nuclear ribonucleoprotein